MTQVVALGSPPWPTVDPFLFCVHHVDAYPAGNDRLGPATSLRGRNLGQDFANVDGWNMYHGQVVPGFPQHPHRGFETVTIARRGLLDHSDSLGAAARFGRGDVQWMTAGAGIVHSEMFPLLDPTGPNHAELFQIWLNLPRADKMVDPYFTMLWNETIPRHRDVDADGRTAVVTVIAGAFDGLRPPPPPPNSWAARADADVAIWTIEFEPDATATLPAALDERTVRTVYVFGDANVRIDGTEVATGHAARVRSDSPVQITADSTPGRSAEVLILQARPIGEPVVSYGPFVMNDRAGIEQAFTDYQRTGFGGWPWPTDDPVHPRDARRFARHADGRIEEPDAQLVP